MKNLKKIGLFLLGLVGLVVICAGIFINHLKPSYDGEKVLGNLGENVTVYYDSYGIPHIYGKSESDAFRALGFVHAQDRLWQMELFRRIGRGGLSEVFGEDLLSTDQFFIALGIDENSKKTVADLDLESKEVQLSLAYLDGINQFIATGPKPIEYYLTGLKREKFVLRDIYNTMGYMAFSFAMAHKTDPLLSTIKAKLGTDYLRDLEIEVDTSTVTIKPYKTELKDSVVNSITANLGAILKPLSIPLFEGSNSWVIAPEKTKNAKVILANDPHIGFAQPAVWYEAHVNAPNYERYGYHIAGIPFPLLAHNRANAYGITMFENDDVDFYYEEENPKNTKEYKTAEGWQAYEEVTKKIKVKDAAAVDFSYKKTLNGPVLNKIADQIKGDRPISMSWAYTKGENKAMKAIFGMCQSRNLKEFETAISHIHAPGLNMMYGDSTGNIAWWAAAKLYKIPADVNTKFVFEPGEGLGENKIFLPFSENPHAINPPWNYVYSANNQPDAISGEKYPGYYLPENRAKRIVALLEAKDDWSREEVGEMINDVTSSVNPCVIKDFVKLVEIKDLSEKQSKVLDAVNSWSGNYSTESIGATIYHKWIYFYLKNTFEDELGPELFNQFLATHLHKRIIAPMASKSNSVWLDNVLTDEIVETQAAIVQTSLLEAIADLEKQLGSQIEKWSWGRIHTLEHAHPFGKIKMLRPFFNVGPFAVNGSREVINNMAFSYDESGTYKVSSGPSTRRVIDFSDIENSMSILPTGQSGNPFSKHYNDQAEMFINGGFRKMLLNKRAIIKTAETKMVFIVE